MSDKPRDRPTVPEVLPLVRAIYASDGGGVGCCLHIVLDDGNVEDEHVAYCLEYARERQHPACVELAEKLLLMTGTQRSRLAQKAYGD